MTWCPNTLRPMIECRCDECAAPSTERIPAHPTPRSYPELNDPLHELCAEAYYGIPCTDTMCELAHRLPRRAL